MLSWEYESTPVCVYVLVLSCHLAFLGRNSPLFWNYVFATLLLLKCPFSFFKWSDVFYGRFYYFFSLHSKIEYPIIVTQFYPSFILWKKKNLGATLLYQKIGIILNNMDCWILDAQLDSL